MESVGRFNVKKTALLFGHIRVKCCLPMLLMLAVAPMTHAASVCSAGKYSASDGGSAGSVFTSGVVFTTGGVSVPGIITMVGIATSDTKHLSGTYINLVVGEDEEIVNDGTLINLTNHGKVSGGILAGTTTNTGILSGMTNTGKIQGGTLTGDIINTNGSVIDVVLNGSLTGGEIEGSLDGNGTIKGALLNASSFYGNVVLGHGVVVGDTTVSAIPDLWLLNLVRTNDGLLDLQTPLRRTANGTQFSVSALIADAISKLLGGTTTVSTGSAATDADNASLKGIVKIVSSALPNTSVRLLPTSLITAPEPDTTLFTNTGDLVITNHGIKASLQPVPANKLAFEQGLNVLKLTLRSMDNQTAIVAFADSRFVFRFSLFTNEPRNSIANTNATAAATFNAEGSLADPLNYKITTHYPSGASQKLVPYVQDAFNFETLMNSAGYSYKMDSISGPIQVFDRNNKLVAKWMPSYNLTANNADTTPRLEPTGDLNSDGNQDFCFVSGDSGQALFGLPL
jgi:hypothetical protein